MTRLHRVRPFMSAFPALTASVLAVGLFSFVSPPGVLAQATALPWDNIPTGDTVPDWSDEVPAHVSFADGETWLDREGTLDAAPAGVPLLAGDRIRTRQGRLEILFADGSVLSLDEHTDAELLSDTLLRVDRGRIRLDLTRTAGSAGYRMDAAGTSTWIQSAGEYRLEVDDRDSGAADVRLLVARGQAELSANGGRTLVRAGYEAFGSAVTTPSLPYAVTVTRWDSFDRWWDDRRATRSGLASAQYLPSEIAYYSGTLDREGDWQYEPAHGYVWYPRVVDDWHPYSAGRWSYVGSYGWTWIGADRWAWPTHHYGRWGYSGRRYYWIPGRQWAPAWVSWASSPGYVGWVPLGYDNRPLISVHIGYSSGWRGWTHVPARSFSAGIVVAQRGRYLPPRGLQFSDRYRGPDRPYTIPRQSVGLRGPAGAARGSVAVPRRVLPREPAASAPPLRSAGGQLRSTPDRDNNQRAAPTMPRRESPVTRSAPSSTPSRSRMPLPSRVPSEPQMPSRPAGTAGRAVRPQVETPSTDSPSRAPLMRSRPPQVREAPAPTPSSRLPAARARQAAPVERTEPSRTAPAMPSRQRTEPSRAPQQAPRIEAPRPGREAPAARQAPARQSPAARQAPSGENRGRAVARPRD